MATINGSRFQATETTTPANHQAIVALARRVRSIQYYINHGKASCPICQRVIANGVPMLNHLRKHTAEGHLTERRYRVELCNGWVTCYGYFQSIDNELPCATVTFEKDRDGNSRQTRWFEHLEDIIGMEQVDSDGVNRVAANAVKQTSAAGLIEHRSPNS